MAVNSPGLDPLGTREVNCVTIRVILPQTTPVEGSIPQELVEIIIIVHGSEVTSSGTVTTIGEHVTVNPPEQLRWEHER